MFSIQQCSIESVLLLLIKPKKEKNQLKHFLIFFSETVVESVVEILIEITIKMI